MITKKNYLFFFLLIAQVGLIAQIPNGGFEESTEGWEQFTPRGAEYTFDIATNDSPEGGQHAVINVTNQGTNSPNQGLSVGLRTGYTIPVTGGTYKLSYRVKSATPDKNFRVRLFINDGGDGGQGTINGEVHIASAEWTLFEQEIVIPELTSTGNPTKFVRILLGVGGTLGDISIDDVVIASENGSAPPVDSDGDGFTADVDCDDENAAINPNAAEVNDNEVDENCDGVLGVAIGSDDGETDGGMSTSTIFTDYPWLSTIVDANNCDGTAIQVYNSAGYVYLNVTTATSAVLYNATGTLYCTSSENYNCLDLYRVDSVIENFACGAAGNSGGSQPVDNDGDGFTADVDCDDTNAAINPNAAEVNDNEVDENCDGVLGMTPASVDSDGDGFTADVDCDDTNVAINPNAVEVNDNEVDENCDGVLGMTVVDPIEPIDPVDPNEGLNLGFEDGMVNWEQFAPRRAEYTFDIATNDSPEGGQHAAINVTSLGTNSPNQGLAAGLRTGYIIPVRGGDYKLSYRIKSATPDKNFRVRLFINDGDEGGQGTINGEVHIAPAEWTLFEQEIVIPELTSTGNPTKFVRVLLGVAGTLGDISIDDIVIAAKEIIPPADNDGDGFTADVDCDDTNAAINPNAAEVDDNLVDENCDGVLGFDKLIRNAAFLSGSWGVRFNLDGGINLDKTSNDKWVDGAQEIVDNLPAVGHVITNFTHPAHGYFYTLRDNPYVDIAEEIHPAMVPSLENEQIILDVIDVLKKSGKKVILYVNGAGPSVIRGDEDDIDAEIGAAWENYYTVKFGGDEALAWRTLAKGYFERFKGLADGYWLDNLNNLPGRLKDFVAMIREVDPNVAIATNGDRAYLMDENNELIYVDSDGIDDEDPRDYRIIRFEISDPYMDFTAGHPTPLGQGAPPNSWAYEEFHFPLIVENPWGSYDGSKDALKHYFVPIRDKWSVARANLVFEVEQAYRFVRTFTDPGAALTWSTTITNGAITDDEMEIMQEINDRMLQSPKPDPQPYVRPEGAYLVGERLNTEISNFTNKNKFNNTTAVQFYPNPVVRMLTIAKTSTDGAYLEVISAMGTKIIEKVWDDGSKTTQLDLSTLNPGIYFLNLSIDNNQRITRKIIISKKR